MKPTSSIPRKVINQTLLITGKTKAYLYAQKRTSAPLQENSPYPLTWEFFKAYLYALIWAYDYALVLPVYADTLGFMKIFSTN